MKSFRFLLGLLVASCAVGTASAQTPLGSVSLSVSLGILLDNLGDPIADGSYLQLVATTSGTTDFGTPSPTDFLGGESDNFVLWSGAFDSSTTGLGGGMLLFLSNLDLFAPSAGAGFLAEGSALRVRWFPQLPAAPAPTVPGTTPFGEFGFGAGDDNWIIPTGAAGTLVELNLITTDVDPSGIDPSFATAALTTQPGGLTPVPEPSTYGLMAAGALAAFVIWRKRREKSPASA